MEVMQSEGFVISPSAFGGAGTSQKKFELELKNDLTTLRAWV
jgi:hypothetical protein